METINQRALLLRASIGAASIKAAATREYTYVAYPKRNRSCLHASDTEITTESPVDADAESLLD